MAGGYDAGHAERKQKNEAMQHFKFVAEHIEHYFERGELRSPADRLPRRCLVGDRSPVAVRHHGQRLVGHFSIDPKAATPEQIKQMARRDAGGFRSQRKRALITEVVGEAHSNGRGAIGLRRVLRSLEVGEVQTLLLGSSFQAPGVKCFNCGHMDMHVAPTCAVCGKDNIQLEDIGDAIVGHSIRNGIEIVYIGADDEEFDRIGRIAALLRFRADQNTSRKVAS